jgi:hypothetical protein
MCQPSSCEAIQGMETSETAAAKMQILRPPSQARTVQIGITRQVNRSQHNNDPVHVLHPENVFHCLLHWIGEDDRFVTSTFWTPEPHRICIETGKASCTCRHPNRAVTTETLANSCVAHR